jgi:DNA-directed RNA polymerase specialized sigma24 family protein
LAEEINLCVLKALEQTEPENLSGYVWRIARNRYARWAEEKSKSREVLSDVETEEIPAETTPDTNVIHTEDIKLLRRELNHLEYVGLMKKIGDKYETAFFIISAFAQDRMYAFAREIAKSLTEKVTAILNTEDKLETP